MKTEFLLEFGYENYRGDYVEEFVVPLYYSGVKLEDGVMCSLGGEIVDITHNNIQSVLKEVIKENPRLTQAWLSCKGFLISIFNFKNEKWELLQ